MLAALFFAAKLQGAALSATATAAEAEELYKRLLKAQDSQLSLECSVLKDAPSKEGEAKPISGTLKVAAGGKALLEFKEPTSQKAVSNGRTLWVQMDDVKQVMKYDAAQMRRSGNFFLDLSSSIKYYAKASTKKLIPVGKDFDPKSTAALELLPKDPKAAGFDSMQVWVDTKQWVVLQVCLRLDGADNRVRFLDIQVAREQKKALADHWFIYKPPKGYQVFDLASMP
jgi:outer membrane lipoprotein-sorting protein